MLNPIRPDSESPGAGSPKPLALEVATGTLRPGHVLRRNPLREYLGPGPVARGPAYSAAKRTLDIVGSLVLAAVFAPLMLVIALLLRQDGGPVIYRHDRVGRGGRIFECLKFRTMVPGADRMLHRLLEQDSSLKGEWVSYHKLRRDPRVTPLGRLLRCTSLDELPQLWNVIRGEMSLVGPRPVMPQELPRYGRNVRGYLAINPGITGLWQVTGRNDADYRRRVVLDTYYMRKQSLLLDLWILLQTIRVVLGGRGAY